MTVIVKKKMAEAKSRIAKYCDSLNVKPKKVLVSETAHEQWLAANRDKIAHGVNRPAVADKYGATYRPQRVIFVNVEAIPSDKKLEDVITREVIQLAKPSYYRTRPIFKSCQKKLSRGEVSPTGRFITV